MSTSRFTIEEVLEATGARRARGRAASAAVADGGFVGVSTDTRKIGPGELFVALEGERFDGHGFLETAASAGAGAAVVRRDHPACAAAPASLALLEVEDTLVALGDLAHFHRRRFAGLPVVAITGSNGKTTTRALTEAALEATLGAGHATSGNFNNLVGLPLTLFGLEARHAFAVVELGMNAPGEIARLTQISEPGVGLVTNAAGVHLEGLGTVAGVARAKAELYDGLAEGAVAVANADDALLLPLARSAAAERGLRLVTFGRDPAADLRLLEVKVGAEDRLQVRVGVGSGGGEPLSFELGLLGNHNALNACAALAAVWALGAELPVAAKALSRVETVGRRLRRTRTQSGATLLDDCYNANLVSMGAALETAAALAEAAGGRLLAALGDMLELGEASESHHQALGTLAAQAGVDRLVSFGPRTVETHARAASGVSHRLHTEDATEAAEFLASAAAGDVVLVKGSRGMQMERIVSLLEAPA